MKTPIVSSPTNPPKAHLFFTIPSQSMESHAYAELFVAKHWVTAIINNRDYSWVTHTSIAIKGSLKTMIIKGDRLEEIMEYEPTKAERSYQPEYFFQSVINKLTRFDEIVEERYIPTPKEKTTTPPRVKRTQKRKITTDGMITVAQMADRLDVSAGKARTALRKAKEPKPTDGWNYEAGSTEANRIEAIIKSSIK